MAKTYYTKDGRLITGWFTANGNHIPIFEGETKAQALSRFKGEQLEKSVFRNKNDNAVRLAKLYGIKLTQNEIIDEEVLITQIEALKQMQEELPQIAKILKENKEPPTSIVVDRLKDDEETGATKSALGDHSPVSNELRINSNTDAFSGDLKKLTEFMERVNRSSKFGPGLASTNDIRHIIVHEYAHAAVKALKLKWKTSKYEAIEDVLKIACDRAGLSNIPTNISSYGNTNHEELLVECATRGYLYGKKADKLSREIWNVLKKNLG